jgi:hypothetical protein
MQDARQRIAGALAGFGIRELTAAKDIEPRALRWLESCSEIQMKRHGRAQRAAGADLGRTCNSRVRALSGRRVIWSGGALEESAGAAINKHPEMKQQAEDGR